MWGATTPRRTAETLLGDIKKLYEKEFVHADVSEFNVLMHGEVPYLIDCGQGVLLEHPKAEQFLRRDVENVLRYFRKYGVERNFDEVMKWVKGSV